MSQELKLSDEVLAQIINILQFALMSGTDIGDLLRQVRFNGNDDNELVLTEEYVEIFKKEIDVMEEKTKALQAQAAIQNLQATENNAN